MSNNDFYVKKNVSLHEYAMHKYIQELEVFNVPKIIAYDIERKILVMEKINHMNVSDFYGEESENVPEKIFNEIRNIIKNLVKYNIEYPDITGYNFIEHDNKIWIIDFEHTRTITGKLNNYVNKFINGLNKWNPDFI
jgi:hypothetical protein